MKQSGLIFVLCVAVGLVGCTLEDAPNGVSCPSGISAYILDSGVSCTDYESCAEIAQSDNYKNSKFIEALADESALRAIQRGLCPKPAFECGDNVCKYIGITHACGLGTHSNPELQSCEPDSDTACGEKLDNCKSRNQLCYNGLCSDNCLDGVLKCITTEDPSVNGVCVDSATNTAFCGAQIENGKCYGYRTCLENQKCIDGQCKCETGYHVGLVAGKDGCVSDTEKECTDQNGELKDCTNMENVLSAKCNSGFGCIINKCMDGYHKSTEGVEACVESDADNCGPQEIVCSQEIEGWKSGRCENSRCVANACKDDYHLYNDGCEKNSTEHCGDHEIRCNIAHAENSCEEGECKFKCDKDYKPKGNICVSSSAESCGSSGLNCADEIDGWVDGTCNGGVCHATECDNQHYPSGGDCVKSDDNHCGSASNDCVTAHGTRKCQNNSCVMIGCDDNYHVNSTNNGCSENSLNNCGKDGYVCEDNISNWNGGECTVDGNCKVTSCKGDTHIYTEENKCEANSMTNCGMHGKSCGSDSHGSFSCVSGGCKLTCNSDSHLSSAGNSCEVDDVNACGQAGYKCSEKVDGWGSGTCESKKCVPKTCKTSYHLYGEICEKDSAEHCGSHGNACPSISMATVSCENKECKYTCISSHWDSFSNKCIPDTPESCGEMEVDCTLLDGWSGTCVSWNEGVGVTRACSATTCTGGTVYEKLSNNIGVCKPIDSSNKCRNKPPVLCPNEVNACCNDIMDCIHIFMEYSDPGAYWRGLEAYNCKTY